MNLHWLISLLLFSTACEIWKAPKRVDELEARVDELSAEVSALTGKPVGAPRDKDDKHDEGSKQAKQEGDGHEKQGKVRDDEEHAKTANGRDPDAPPIQSKKRHEEERHDDDERQAKEKPATKHAAHFAYTGADGPAEWGNLDDAWKACKAGKSQSPIDIVPKAVGASPITFRYRPTAGAVVDNGHTLQVNLAEGSSIVIDDHSYELVQFHVHTPSEHTIAGETYPLEVHLVHKDRDGKLAVVGVLYDIGADSKALASVWKKWPAKPNTEKKLDKEFDPTALLPETRTVYRYEGSLTTPPCTEGVVWNVMRRTMTDSKNDLAIVGLHLTANARPVQPLGDRSIE